MLIEGYAAYFHNIDDVGDTVDPKAFKETLAKIRKQKRNIPVLREHNKTDILGVVKKFKVDKKGLFCEIKLFKERESIIKECKKNKIQLGFSIGYRPVKYTDGGNPCQHRTLINIDLIEISIVLWPANNKCIVNYVK